MVGAGVFPLHRRNSQARAGQPAVLSVCSGSVITQHQGTSLSLGFHLHKGCGAEPRAREDRHSGLLWLREEGLLPCPREAMQPVPLTSYQLMMFGHQR